MGSGVHVEAGEAICTFAAVMTACNALIGGEIGSACTFRAALTGRVFPAALGWQLVWYESAQRAAACLGVHGVAGPLHPCMPVLFILHCVPAALFSLVALSC